MEVEATAPSYTPLEIPSMSLDGDKRFFQEDDMYRELNPPLYASFQKSPTLDNSKLPLFAQYQNIQNIFNRNPMAPPYFDTSNNFFQVCIKVLIFYWSHLYLINWY